MHPIFRIFDKQLGLQEDYHCVDYNNDDDANDITFMRDFPMTRKELQNNFFLDYLQVLEN